jgi:predicted enzyme related to lactoylglutathione lyase
MLSFKSLLVFSDNPQKLADFYKGVFQKEPDWQGGEYYGFSVDGGIITVGPHDKVHGLNSNPERLIFNFDTEDVKGEFDRIKNLGTTVIAEPYQPAEDTDAWLATFADPDGNFFQLATPWRMSRSN